MEFCIRTWAVQPLPTQQSRLSKSRRLKAQEKILRLDIGERSVLGEALHRPVEPLCLDGAFGDGFVVDFEGDSARLREKQLNGCQSFADCHKPRIKT